MRQCLDVRPTWPAGAGCVSDALVVRRANGASVAITARVQPLGRAVRDPIYSPPVYGEFRMFSRHAATLGLALAMFGALSLIATTADARVGGGGSFGSRGSRTYSSPPATNTAPRTAPIEKSITQPGKAPVTAPTAGSKSWSGGWRGILLGGLFARPMPAVVRKLA